MRDPFRHLQTLLASRPSAPRPFLSETLLWVRPRLQALPQLPGGLRPWITLLSLGFVLAALLSQGRQLLQLRLDPQGWLWLALGVGFSLFSLVVGGLAWASVLRWLGFRPRLAPLIALFISSNLRKFLPGGIWHLASRVQALRRGDPVLPQAAGTTAALVAVMLEPLVAAVAAMALVAMGGWQSGLAPLALLPVVLLVPRWLDPLLWRLERKKARDLGMENELVSDPLGQPQALGLERRAYPWQPLLIELAFVLLRFAGFACCVQAFDVQQQVSWFTWLAGFSLAWTAGLVVPGAPGGLGVFEAVLLLRLGVVVAQPPLVAVALSYRLVVTLADVLGAAVVDLDQRLST